MTTYFCFLWLLIQLCLGLFSSYLDVIYTPDSSGYINFDSSRTVGYPLFLWLVKALTYWDCLKNNGVDPYYFIPYIQLTLLWGSIAYVARPLKPFASWLWVLGMAALSLGLKGFYSFEIMTEALFIALHLVALGLMFRQKSIVWVSLCVGLIILTRPSGYATVPALLIYAWFARLSLSKAILPIMGCILFGVGAQVWVNGNFSTQSHLGSMLIGKIAFTVKPDMKSQDPERQKLIQHMAADLEPIQKEVQSAPSGPIRYFLSASIYDVVRYKKISSYEEGVNINPREHNDFWKKLGVEVITQNPVGYIQDVWMNWQALWFVWDFMSIKDRIIRKQCAESLTQKFPDIVFERLEHKTRYFWVVWGIRCCLFFALTLSLFFMCHPIFFRKRQTPHSLILFFISLAAHGNIMLTALLQAGLPRFVLVFWPYLFLMVVLWLETLYERYCRSDSML